MSRRCLIRIAIILWLVVGLFVAPIGTVRSEPAAPTSSTIYDLYRRLEAGQLIPPKSGAFRKPTRPTVYLTFDDGPSKLTERALDILRKENVKATFFILGVNAPKHPSTLRRIHREGHALGNHTYNHRYSQLYSRGFTAFWGQLGAAERSIYNITGVKPRLVRAPGGTPAHFDPFYYYYLQEAGYLVHDWDIDCSDANPTGTKASTIVRTVKSFALKKEMTVLMHDGDGHQETIKALPEVIRYFRSKGYTFAALTPQVRPVQFPVKQQKWDRNVTLPEFADWVTKVRAHAKQWK